MVQRAVGVRPRVVRCDEPALWEKSLDGRILHWIEVGQPDAERLTRCSRRAERVSLLAYGNLRVWQSKVIDAVKGLKNLSIASIDSEALAALVRTCRVACSGA